MTFDHIIASMTPEQKQAVAALIDLHNECNSELRARIAELEAVRSSTAEAQARALEDAADNLLNQADRMENSSISQRATRDAAWFLSAEAKRIRGEG